MNNETNKFTEEGLTGNLHDLKAVGDMICEYRDFVSTYGYIIYYDDVPEVAYESEGWINYNKITKDILGRND